MCCVYQVHSTYVLCVPGPQYVLCVPGPQYVLYQVAFHNSSMFPFAGKVQTGRQQSSSQVPQLEQDSRRVAPRHGDQDVALHGL